MGQPMKAHVGIEQLPFVFRTLHRNRVELPRWIPSGEAWKVGFSNRNCLNKASIPLRSQQIYRKWIILDVIPCQPTLWLTEPHSWSAVMAGQGVIWLSKENHYTRTWYPNFTSPSKQGLVLIYAHVDYYLFCRRIYIFIIDIHMFIGMNIIHVYSYIKNTV